MREYFLQESGHFLGVSHRRVHFFFLTGSGGSRAANIASSKTFFNPFCVSAEHSTYFTALSSRASFSADSTVMGFCFTLESFSMVAASSRKSICVPTSRKGVLGQWWVISGTHCGARRRWFNYHHYYYNFSKQWKLLVMHPSFVAPPAVDTEGG